MFSFSALMISLVAMRVDIICVDMLILSEEVAYSKLLVLIFMVVLCCLFKVMAL